MYEKILVATDGSETAAAAVEHAADLAKLAGSKEVVVIHVCPACTPELDPDSKNREIATNIVNEAGEAVASEGIQVRTVLEMDYPHEEVGEALLEIIKNEKADLLVLGSRGLSEFKGILVGSVSHKVLQHAECPVLVIKGK
ncbi:MAG: universal stress protein [Thermoleophilia bacterium]|nr:universal stress protein [Thermoleophilia bacterium]